MNPGPLGRTGGARQSAEPSDRARREAGQPVHDSESGGRAAPVLSKSGGAGSPYDRSQHQGHDDDVLGVAEHRNEVRNEIEWQGQVAQHESRPPAMPRGNELSAARARSSQTRSAPNRFASRRSIPRGRQIIRARTRTTQVRAIENPRPRTIRSTVMCPVSRRLPSLWIRQSWRSRCCQSRDVNARSRTGLSPRPAWELHLSRFCTGQGSLGPGGNGCRPRRDPSSTDDGSPGCLLSRVTLPRRQGLLHEHGQVAHLADLATPHVPRQQRPPAPQRVGQRVVLVVRDPAG